MARVLARGGAAGTRAVEYLKDAATHGSQPGLSFTHCLPPTLTKSSLLTLHHAHESSPRQLTPLPFDASLHTEYPFVKRHPGTGLPVDTE